MQRLHLPADTKNTMLLANGVDTWARHGRIFCGNLALAKTRRLGGCPRPSWPLPARQARKKLNWHVCSEFSLNFFPAISGYQHYQSELKWSGTCAGGGKQQYMRACTRPTLSRTICCRKPLLRHTSKFARPSDAGPGLTYSYSRSSLPPCSLLHFPVVRIRTRIC